MQPPGPSAHRPGPRPSLSISQSARRENLLQCKPPPNTRRISFIFFLYIYLFSPSLSPLLQQLGEEAINGRGGQEKMNKDACIPGRPGGQNEGFSGEERGRRRRTVEFSKLNGGQFERGFDQLEAQRWQRGASSAKLPTPARLSAATIGKLSFSHSLLHPQGTQPMGLSCPRSCGDTRETAEGSFGWSLAPTHSMHSTLTCDTPRCLQMSENLTMGSLRVCLLWAISKT